MADEIIGMTKGGKEIKLVRMGNRSLMLIQFGSGGKQPKEFEGGFSDRATAIKVVMAYLNKNDGELNPNIVV